MVGGGHPVATQSDSGAISGNQADAAAAFHPAWTA